MGDENQQLKDEIYSQVNEILKHHRDAMVEWEKSIAPNLQDLLLKSTPSIGHSILMNIVYGISVGASIGIVLRFIG